VDFRIIGEIRDIETIAINRGIRELDRLQELYGGSRWRKRKGIATIQLRNGRIRIAEVHWYEAHGVGRRGMKRKRYVD
jgi:hypothetical protein